jgi:hypothetical protein
MNASTGETVAVKVIHKGGLDEEGGKRVALEVDAMIFLAFFGFLGCQETLEFAYLILEYCPGGGKNHRSQSLLNSVALFFLNRFVRDGTRPKESKREQQEQFSVKLPLGCNTHTRNRSSSGNLTTKLRGFIRSLLPPATSVSLSSLIASA